MNKPALWGTQTYLHVMQLSKTQSSNSSCDLLPIIKSSVTVYHVKSLGLPDMVLDLVCDEIRDLSEKTRKYKCEE